MTEETPSPAPVWLLRAGRRGRYATDFVDAGVIAIGCPAVGDLGGRDRADLVQAVRAEYGDKGAPGNAGMLYRFANEIAFNDWVLTPDSETLRSTLGGSPAIRSSAPIRRSRTIRTFA